MIAPARVAAYDILRAISTGSADLPTAIAFARARLPDERDRALAAAIEYLSVALSHPRWLAAGWYDRLGLDAAEAWMRFDNTSGSVTLRANRLRLTRDELAAQLAADDITVHPTTYAPDGLIVDEGH